VNLDNSSLRLADDVTFQSMGPGEQTVLLSLATGQLYTCNETTRAFLEALDGRRTVREIADELAGRFEVETRRLGDDLERISGQLLAEGLIVVVVPAGPDHSAGD